MTNELTLTLDFEVSPSAGDMGQVFSALARDYHGSSGRTLVVLRVDRGSIVATFTDADLISYVGVAVGGGLAAIGAINTLATFAENLKKWFGYARSKTEAKRLYQKGRKRPGQRSVEAIIKIAAETGSNVRVKFESARGDTLEAELTSAEAISARNQQDQGEVNLVRSELLPRALRDREVQTAIERLRQIDAQKLGVADVDAIVDVIVAVLKANGAGLMLPEIASQLELSGFANIAHAVRRHINPSAGPPLSIT